MSRGLTGVAFALACAAWSCGSSPAAPASSSGPSGSPGTPAAAPATSTAFSVDLPVAEGDTANNGLGIWPFGVHGSSHALDGHPGFDIEFRPGASVRAAADGTIQNAVRDSNFAGRFSIRISHGAGSQTYATDYTNIESLAAGIAAGAAVTRGQVLGLAGVQTQFIGSSPVTYAMTHFQVNDFTQSVGLSNPNAVSPSLYFTPAAQRLFDTLWQAAAYRQEWCEPFVANSRLGGFPFSRTWTLQSGSLPVQLEVRCVSSSSLDFEYTFRAAGGSAVETGLFQIAPTARPLTTIDLSPSTGGTRLGVYDILSDRAQLQLGALNAARPASLTGPDVSTYTTR